MKFKRKVHGSHKDARANVYSESSHNGILSHFQKDSKISSECKHYKSQSIVSNAMLTTKRSLTTYN